MKRLLSLLTLVFAMGLSSVAMEAEAAKRMGSGKSMGTQRQAAPDKAPPAATPAATPAAGAAAAAPSRSWMGPVAGLAAGLGIAALASHLGFGDELASMVMMGLIAAAIMVAIGFFMRKRAAAQKSGATGPGSLQYAHVNPAAARDAQNKAAQNVPAYKVLMHANGGSTIGSGIGSSIGANSASRIPADFDTAGSNATPRSTSSVCKPPTMQETWTISASSLRQKCLPNSKWNWQIAAPQSRKPTW